MQRITHPLLQNISGTIISLAQPWGRVIHIYSHTIPWSQGRFEEIQQEIPGVSQLLPALRFQLSPTEMRWKIQWGKIPLCSSPLSSMYTLNIWVSLPVIPDWWHSYQRILSVPPVNSSPSWSLELNYLTKELEGKPWARLFQIMENTESCSRQVTVLPRELGKLCPPLREAACLHYCVLPFQFFHQAFWRILVGFRRCACWKAKEQYQYQQDFFHYKTAQGCWGAQLSAPTTVKNKSLYAFIYNDNF